jgi:AcrR family transcriptional regulator
MDSRARSRTRLAAAERRETILRAATEVFAQAGYRAGKVSDVAALVGVTEPVIFQNFGSKAALFAAVLDRAAAEVRAALDDLSADFGSAYDMLTHVVTQAEHSVPGQHSRQDSRHHGAPHTGAAYGVLFAAAAALTTESGLADHAQNVLGAVAGHLADLIQRAQVEGTIEPGTDPQAGAWLLLSLLSARRLRASAMPAALEPVIAALVLRALGGEAPEAATSDRPRSGE